MLLGSRQGQRECGAGALAPQKSPSGKWRGFLPGLGVVPSSLLVKPLLWTHGTGAEVMQRIAAPMVGGMVTSTILTLVVIPAVYFLWRRRGIETATGARNSS